MPDQTQSNNQQQVIIYALVAIAVLLAAIVGFMIYQRTTAIPGPTAAAASATASAASGSTSVTGTNPAPAADTPFDPKTATKLAAGQDPVSTLTAYAAAIMANKYDVAFGLLPLASKNSYSTPASMESQLKPYGITGFKQGKATVSGADTTIVLEEDTPAMNINYTWVFTKVGNTWYVKGRKMGGTL
jgi:hypothetical protein